MLTLCLLPSTEQHKRLESVYRGMTRVGIDAALLCDNADLYYLTGRVFRGWVYLAPGHDPLYFIHRPNELTGPGVIYVRKPEEIAATLGSDMLASIGLECDQIDYSTVTRLAAVFNGAVMHNISPVMRAARAVKTSFEIDLIRQSGIKQERIYRRIPHMYREGMTDLELQVEIERASRLEGCLGQFRVAGNSMEIYMGNVLAGDNADTPSPYDFAMGGAGLDPSLPVGCDGSVIHPHQAVMVDMNGNYTGYMTDMTRTFSIGELPEQAVRAHQCSIDICAAMRDMAVEGAAAKDLYHKAAEMAREAGLEAEFMGHRQKAGFVGHGVGIEINELPVIAPRSRDILQAGNVIAFEPKFVIPKVGAVGIENTYAVRAGQPAEQLTNAPEQLISLV